MKRAIGVLAAICMSVSLFADVQLMDTRSRATESVVTFTLDEYKLDTVTENGEQYVTVTSPDLSGKRLEKGKPELPFTTVNLLVDTENPSLEIVSVKFKSISVLPILPSKGSLTRSVNPATIPVKKGDIYAKDLWFPEEVANLSPVYMVRSVQGVTVQISPFIYNPATGVLKIAEEITFSVKGAGNSSRSAVTETSEEFQELIQERFLNVSKSRYTPVSDGDKMIVIVTEKLKEQIKPLVEWKNQKGIETTIHVYPTETGNDTTGLKKFIKDKYDSDKITYVLIVGDGEIIPTPTMPSDEGPGFDPTVTTDPIYGMVAGDDVYYDLFVGRMPAKDAKELTNMVNKVLTYEKTPKAGADWYSKALSVGSDEGTPMDYEWLRDSINSALTNYGFTCELMKPGDGSGDVVVTKVNDGRSILNYMGHGSPDALAFNQFNLDTTQVKSMTNGDMLPVVIPLACNYGNFIGRESPAEYWLRNEKGGAIVVVASSPQMSWTPPQYAQVEMARLMAAEKYNSFGAYFYNGCMKMIDYESDRTAKTWVYFGDPSLQLFTKTPTVLSAAISRGEIVEGSNQVTFTTEAGARVTICKGDEILANTVAEDGKAAVKFDAKKGDSITITVTKRNRVPHIETVEVGGTSILNSSFSESRLAPLALAGNQMSLSVPSKGVYSIALLSVNGRVLSSGSYSLSQGSHKLHVNNNLPSKSVVIVRIQGSGQSVVRRMLVQ